MLDKIIEMKTTNPNISWREIGESLCIHPEKARAIYRRNKTNKKINIVDQLKIQLNFEIEPNNIDCQKAEYHEKLRQQEVKKLQAELQKYWKKDYFYDKVINEMNVPVRKLEIQPKKNEYYYTEGQLNLADWHIGLQVENYWNSYNIEIAKQRLKLLTERVITYIHRHKVKRMHVMNLGDLLHGLIHVSTRVVAECDVIQQFRYSWQLIGDVLEAIANEVEEVNFYSTYGNHSRITEKKEDALDRENLEFLLFDVLSAHLKEFKNITFIKNEYDDQILVADICGYTVFGIHGDRDRPEKVAGNLTMMLERKPYKIFTAHSHHKQQLEVHKVDVIMSRALCGVDDYAKGIRATSRAGQSFYVYNENGLECTYDITFN